MRIQRNSDENEKNNEAFLNNSHPFDFTDWLIS